MKTITLEISDKVYNTLCTNKMVAGLCSDGYTAHSIEKEIVGKLLKAIKEGESVCELKYKSEGVSK